MKKYTMKVTIANPTDESKKKSFTFTAEFDTDDTTPYGNKYYVSIKGNGGFEQYYDLRYDTQFDANNMKNWLNKWANTYWSGNGCYKLTSIDIHEFQ